VLSTATMLSVQPTTFGDPRFEVVTLRTLTIRVTVIYRPAAGHGSALARLRGFEGWRAAKLLIHQEATSVGRHYTGVVEAT
jgi:hypothetical protein